MKLSFRVFSAFFILFLNFQAHSKTPTFPMIFCTNETNNWIGTHVVNISFPDARGSIFATVSEHLEDAVITVAKTLITQQQSHTNLHYIGTNFSFYLDLKNYQPNAKNLVRIQFKTKFSKVFDEEFACYFAQSKEQTGYHPNEIL